MDAGAATLAFTFASSARVIVSINDTVCDAPNDARRPDDGNGGRTLERLTEQDVLLTFKETEDFLRVSRATIYRLIWSGQLIGHKVGKGWRFYRSDLRQLVEDATPHLRPQAPATVTEG